MSFITEENDGILMAEFDDLQLFTNNFSQENFISQAQFCNLYHGKIPDGWRGMEEGQDVTVKVWQTGISAWVDGEKAKFCRKEVAFLTLHNMIPCPNMPKLIAFCVEDESDRFGVVYDLKSFDTLQNLFDKDEFKWLDRIKVAVGLAHLLEFLHCYEPAYLVRDLSAAHIMLDQDFNPVLFNFSLLTGGLLPEDTSAVNRDWYGSICYVEPTYVMTGGLTMEMDVYAMGVILLELIFKCKVDCARHPRTGEPTFLPVIARYPWKGFGSKPSKDELERSFVDKSFEEDPGFDAHDGPKITRLARRCIDYDSESMRPSMQEFVEELKQLHVVRNYSEIVMQMNPIFLE